MQLWRMRFARIECDNHALGRDIDCYVSNSGNVLQHRSQFAHAFIAIFTSVAISIFPESRGRRVPEKMDRPDRDQQVI